MRIKPLTRHFHNNEIVKVLKIKPFFLMIVSEFFAQLAFNMQHFVLIFLLFDITHSNTSVSGLILSFTIPAVLFSLVSGAYVDRWEKVKVLFTTNLLRGILTLPFIFADLHLGFIYLLTFLMAVATQFFIPAESAIIPNLVPRSKLVAANAVFSLGIYSTVFLGYILSGPILLLIGRQSTIILLAIFFFIGTFFVWIMGRYNKKHEIITHHMGIDIERSLKHEIREALVFIRKTRKVTHALIVLTLSQSIVFMFAVLGPGFITEILKVRVESLSLIILLPAAIGIGIGGFMIGSYSKKLNFKVLNSLGFLISGIAFVLLPIVDNFVASQPFSDFVRITNINIGVMQVVILFSIIAGFANSMIFIPANVIVQSNTNEEIRGKVYGFLNALTGAVSLLPVVLAGGLADIFGVNHVIIIVGICMVFLSVIFYILD